MISIVACRYNPRRIEADKATPSPVSYTIRSACTTLRLNQNTRGGVGDGYCGDFKDGGEWVKVSFARECVE